MQRSPLKKKPADDTPKSFREASEVNTTHKSLRLRTSESATAAAPCSSPQGVLTTSTPPQPALRRSGSLVLPATHSPSEERSSSTGITAIIAACVDSYEPSGTARPLYMTNVRSCGHPQPLYVKVPVVSSAATNTATTPAHTAELSSSVPQTAVSHARCATAPPSTFASTDSMSAGAVTAVPLATPTDHGNLTSCTSTVGSVARLPPETQRSAEEEGDGRHAAMEGESLHRTQVRHGERPTSSANAMRGAYEVESARVSASTEALRSPSQPPTPLPPVPLAVAAASGGIAGRRFAHLLASSSSSSSTDAEEVHTPRHTPQLPSSAPSETERTIDVDPPALSSATGYSAHDRIRRQDGQLSSSDDERMREEEEEDAITAPFVSAQDQQGPGREEDAAACPSDAPMEEEETAAEATTDLHHDGLTTASAAAMTEAPRDQLEADDDIDSVEDEVEEVEETLSSGFTPAATLHEDFPSLPEGLSWSASPTADQLAAFCNRYDGALAGSSSSWGVGSPRNSRWPAQTPLSPLADANASSAYSIQPSTEAAEGLAPPVGHSHLFYAGSSEGVGGALSAVSPVEPSLSQPVYSGLRSAMTILRSTEEVGVVTHGATQEGDAGQLVDTEVKEATDIHPVPMLPTEDSFQKVHHILNGKGEHVESGWLDAVSELGVEGPLQRTGFAHPSMVTHTSPMDDSTRPSSATLAEEMEDIAESADGTVHSMATSSKDVASDTKPVEYISAHQESNNHSSCGSASSNSAGEKPAEETLDDHAPMCTSTRANTNPSPGPASPVPQEDGAERQEVNAPSSSHNNGGKSAQNTTDNFSLLPQAAITLPSALDDENRTLATPVSPPTLQDPAESAKPVQQPTVAPLQLSPATTREELPNASSCVSSSSAESSHLSSPHVVSHSPSQSKEGAVQQAALYEIAETAVEVTASEFSDVPDNEAPPLAPATRLLQLTQQPQPKIVEQLKPQFTAQHSPTTTDTTTAILLQKRTPLSAQEPLQTQPSSSNTPTSPSDAFDLTAELQQRALAQECEQDHTVPVRVDSGWYWPSPSRTSVAATATTVPSPIAVLLDALQHTSPSAPTSSSSPPSAAAAAAAQPLTPTPHRPRVSRKLLSDVEEEGENEEEDQAPVPAAMPVRRSRTIPPPPPREVKGAYPRADTADASCSAFRDFYGSSAVANIAVVVELEFSGRRAVMAEMLSERETILRLESSEYANLCHAASRQHSPIGGRAQGLRMRWSASTPGTTPPGTVDAVTAHPTSPTRRAEVRALLRARGISDFGLCFGVVTAAALTDELLSREVIEDAEVRTRIWLRRLRQCEADALSPISIFERERLAWQRVTEAERSDRHRLRAAQLSRDVAAASGDDSYGGFFSLLNIGREIALCLVAEEEERYEVVERAEQARRRRLLDLFRSGLAARLRQHAVMDSMQDALLQDAIDDVCFAEAQVREELRVEGIRKWTALLETQAGVAVRESQQHHWSRKRQRPDTTPEVLRRRTPPRGSSSAEKPAVHTVEQTRKVVTPRVPTDADAAPAPVEEEVEDEWAAVEEIDSEGEAVSSPKTATHGSTSAPQTHPVPPASKIAAAVDVESLSSSSSSASSSVVLKCRSSGAAGGGPQFFQWDPTSNSNPTTHGSGKGSGQAPNTHSTSSPSPHLTNMTTLSTTHVTTTSTHTTPSSSLMHTGNEAVRLKRVSVVASSSSRRSPTTVLPTGPSAAYSAEVSALMHALHNTEGAVAAVRGRGGAAEFPSGHVGLEKEMEVVYRSPLDPAWTMGAATLATTAQPEELLASEYYEDEGTVSVPRTPALLPANRHLVPCSLHRTRTPSARGHVSSPSSGASSSPRRYSDAEALRYDAVTTRQERGTPRGSAAMMEPPWERARLQQQRFGEIDDFSAVEEEAEDGEEKNVLRLAGLNVSRSVNSNSTAPRTAAREARFPVAHLHTRRRSLSSRAPPRTAASPPKAAEPPLAVVEVISPSCVPPGLGGACEVSLSPLTPSRSPSKLRPPQAYASATAAWSTRLRQRQLQHFVLANDPSAVNNVVSEEEDEEDYEETEIERAVAVQRCGCSRRRSDDGPLLITRLPFECGPGVWPSAPSERQTASQGEAAAAATSISASPFARPQRESHLIMAASPYRTRPAARTLDEALELAARSGDVVRLPTTVAELLQGPKHGRLQLSQDDMAEEKGRGSFLEATESRAEGPKKVATCGTVQRPSLFATTASPSVCQRRSVAERSGGSYSYVDVFYRASSSTASHAAPSAAVQHIAARCSAVRARDAQQQRRVQHSTAAPLNCHSPPSLPSPAAVTVSSASASSQPSVWPSTAARWSNAATASAVTNTRNRSASSVSHEASSSDYGHAEEEESFFDGEDALLCSAVAARVRQEQAVAQHRRGHASRTNETRGSHGQMRGGPRGSSSMMASASMPSVRPMEFPPNYRVRPAASPKYLRPSWLSST